MLYVHKTITYVILNYIIYFIISVTLIYFKSTFESVFICMKFYFVCLILPVSVINSKPFKDCAFISIGEQLITAEVFCCYHGLGWFAGVYLCFCLFFLFETCGPGITMWFRLASNSGRSSGSAFRVLGSQYESKLGTVLYILIFSLSPPTLYVDFA